MIIPTAVVAHPDRREMAGRLARQVHAEAISWDSHHRGCTRNHQQAWEYLTGAPCPWVMVLEDDAVPCEEFLTQLHQVLRVAPTPFVSLYLGRGRPPHWQEPISSVIAREACFLRSDTLLHTVGYVLRTELLSTLRRAVVESARSNLIECPEAITRWAKRQGLQFCYTRPSLVDHRDTSTVTPVGDRPDGQERDQVRKAWLFDARESWNPTSIDLPNPQCKKRSASSGLSVA